MFLFSPYLLNLFSFNLHKDFTVIPILTFRLKNKKSHVLYKHSFYCLRARTSTKQEKRDKKSYFSTRISNIYSYYGLKILVILSPY